jgi:hypothetical protein
MIYIYIYIFIINDLCTSLLHTQYTLVYIFLLHCSNFVKVCKRMCTNHDPFFFLLVEINLNHNIILYFLDYFSLLRIFFFFFFC